MVKRKIHIKEPKIALGSEIQEVYWWTRNSTQHSLTTYVAIKSKERGDICITGSLCCTADTNTTLYINYTPITINLKK